ncbi:hypothetical protein OE88DRAFT_1602123, partial [Heliocybe sulcata]
SSVSRSTGFAPFELNYGAMPRMTTVLRPEVVKPGVQQFAEQALFNLAKAHDTIIESRVVQTHYANKKRRPEDPIPVGALVYLSTEN